ncbi:MAG: DUF5615 family PIN-like protein, partial [Deltaproteobacteria bacterium]|nr:DUF5615 family PIN-like protein [Deltaproteobacteria bacterium]
MPPENIKFLVDVGAGKTVESWLRDHGYDVRAVRDIDPYADDSSILDLADRESRMVITMDKDFGELVFKSNLKHRGVLLLRLEDADGKEKMKVVEYILSHFENEIVDRFCVYKNGRLRI